MPAQTSSLFLLEDLDDVGRTSELADSDLGALHAVADWIKTFVVKPHKDLGRAGTVCPFVPGVTGDWKFFLDDEEWLNLWARRYGESAVHALAEELRRLPWRMGRD